MEKYFVIQTTDVINQKQFYTGHFCVPVNSTQNDRLHDRFNDRFHIIVGNRSKSGLNCVRSIKSIKTSQCCQPFPSNKNILNHYKINKEQLPNILQDFVSLDAKSQVEVMRKIIAGIMLGIN